MALDRVVEEGQASMSTQLHDTAHIKHSESSIWAVHVPRLMCNNPLLGLPWTFILLVEGLDYEQKLVAALLKLCSNISIEPVRRVGDIHRCLDIQAQSQS